MATIEKVPGETNVTNNTHSFPVTFTLRLHAARPAAHAPRRRSLILSAVHDLTSTAGIVAIAAAAVAVVALLTALALAFRLRRLRAEQRMVLGDRREDLVAHAARCRASSRRCTSTSRTRRAARPADGTRRAPARRGGRLHRRWSATTPTARCPAASRCRSRCWTPPARGSCSPRSTTATRRACTPSRSTRAAASSSSRPRSTRRSRRLRCRSGRAPPATRGR